MSTKFDDSFGFTQKEIDSLLECYGLENKSSDIRHWYDGYKFNDVEIYNPWSVLNYLSEATDKKFHSVQTILVQYKFKRNCKTPD